MIRRFIHFSFSIIFIICFSHLYAEYPSFKLVSGSSNPELAKEVAKQLGMPLSLAKVEKFNDGEIKIQISESIRGKDIFILQSTCSSKSSSVNDNIMELYLLIRACKRSSARSITAVIPYYGYARQDRKVESRVPISASDIALLLEHAGVNQVISVDLHCGQIQGFFHNIAVDNLTSAMVFVPYFAKMNLDNLVVVAPDAGALERAKDFITGLSIYGVKANLAVIVKQRLQAGVVEKVNLVGDVKGSNVLIVDDICDTAGTLVHAAAELKKHGAKKVFACISHPVFSGPALDRIANSCFEELVVSDTIAIKAEVSNKVKQISIANLLAEAIKRSHANQSLAELFLYRNHKLAKL